MKFLPGVNALDRARIVCHEWSRRTDWLSGGASENEGDDMLILEDDDPPEDTTDTPEPQPEPRPGKNPRPKRNTGPVDVRSGKDLSKGFARANKAAKGCGKPHGAIGGQSIAVQAAIKSNGQVLSANATGLNRNTPLGKCVANAVKNKARFVASKQPLQTETRTFKM